jgi:hypothetical protein
MNTKVIAEQQIAFVFVDCEVISENNTIKCLKCNVIIKSHVGDNGEDKPLLQSSSEMS